MEEASNADKVAIIDNGKIIVNETPMKLKEKYTTTILKLIPTDEEKLIKYLDENKYDYKKRTDMMEVYVKKSLDSLKILKDIEDNLTSFEVLEGNMDTVFINLTGKDIERFNMKNIKSLTKRNLLLFFRDKATVFFSFLSVIIILGLYILFLSDLQVQSVEEVVGKIEGIKPLVNSWVMAGLIAVSTVTLSLGALGVVVADRENNAMNDFLVAPIKREQVFLSYLLSSIIIAMIISLTLFVIAEIYIISSGGTVLTIIPMLKVIGIIALCVLSSSLLMLFVISFLKSEQSVGVLGTIVGTMIGFLTGAYVPMGIMPKGIQIVSNVIPVSQGASLLRKYF